MPIDDAEKSMVYVELAKLSQESFLNRRNYEWQTAFGLWTAIGLITYFAATHTDTITASSTWALIGFYAVMILIWVICWQYPLRRAFLWDQRWKHYYMHMAEGRPPTEPKEPTIREIVTDWRWTYGQTAITLVFVFASVIIISGLSGTSKGKSEVEFKASGGTVKLQTETSP